MGVKKGTNETTDIIRQNENLYLKKFVYKCLLIKENLYLKS